MCLFYLIQSILIILGPYLFMHLALGFGFVLNLRPFIFLFIKRFCIAVEVAAHNGKDKTSSSVTSKQKEERPNTYQCHYNYILQLSRCVGCIFPVCHLSALV